MLKEKGQRTIYKTLHRILKIEQHETKVTADHTLSQKWMTTETWTVQ
jgi:hypothetical protein